MLDYSHFECQKNKITEFLNSVDAYEVDHNEIPHQDLHCLIALYSSNFQYDTTWMKDYLKYYRSIFKCLPFIFLQ